MFKRNKQKGTNKQSLFVQKIKTNISNQKQYKIFESKQFLGIIMLVIFSFLMIVSIVQVPGFSTINSYTVGMLFGYYSYFIDVSFIVWGLCLLFQIDTRIEKFIAKKFNKKFHFSWLPFLFFALGIALVIESISKAVSSKTVFPGLGAFKEFFKQWWYSFSNQNGAIGSAALPNIMNSGIIVALFMSLLVSWSGYVISIIIGLIFIIHFVLYVIYGSLIKKIKTKIADPYKKDEVKKDEFQEYKTKIMDLSFEDNSAMIEKPDIDFLSDVEAKTKTISIDNPDEIFEFDDPFDEEKNREKQKFFEEKTAQINLDKKLTNEVNLSNMNNKKLPDIETFDFELDLFNTDINAIDKDINDISIDLKDKK